MGFVTHSYVSNQVFIKVFSSVRSIHLCFVQYSCVLLLLRSVFTLFFSIDVCLAQCLRVPLLLRSTFTSICIIRICLAQYSRVPLPLRSVFTSVFSVDVCVAQYPCVFSSVIIHSLAYLTHMFAMIHLDVFASVFSINMCIVQLYIRMCIAQYLFICACVWRDSSSVCVTRLIWGWEHVLWYAPRRWASSFMWTRCLFCNYIQHIHVFSILQLYSTHTCSVVCSSSWGSTRNKVL